MRVRKLALSLGTTPLRPRLTFGAPSLTTHPK